MKKKILGFVLKCRYMVLSISQAKYMHIGDIVIYKRERYVVCNGTAKPSWDIILLDNPNHEPMELVHQHYLKKELSWINIKNSLFFVYKWKMNNWYYIDLDRLMKGKKVV